MNAFTLLLLALIGASSPAKEAQPLTPTDSFSPSQLAQAPNCVDANQQAGDRTITVHLHNSCTNSVDCNVSWTARCGNGPVQSKHWSGSIESASSQDVLVSVDCPDDGWSIQPPTWNCTPKK